MKEESHSHYLECQKDKELWNGALGNVGHIYIQGFHITHFFKNKIRRSNVIYLI